MTTDIEQKLNRRITNLSLGEYGTVFVEISPSNDWNIEQQNGEIQDLPEGAEPTSTKQQVADAAEILKQNFRSISHLVADSMSSAQPEEWTLELNIGFKGKVTPIPVILSGESDVSLKVVAKWKKISD